jgi:hypothetical protein
MEGLSKLKTFEKFLSLAESSGANFVTLDEIAGRAKTTPCEIVPGTLPGRAGTVFLQSPKLSTRVSTRRDFTRTAGERSVG